MSKIVIDTNILIYAIDNNSPHQSKSQAIINNQAYELYITSKNISEFYAVATRGTNPLVSVKDTIRVIKHYRAIMDVLYPDENSSKELDNLIQKYQPRGLKVHDFEIAAIAISNGITQLATFNVADFKKIKEIDIVEP